MSRVFIDRPIFAWVIAIIVMLMGIGAITRLPIAQYPDVAPTQINVRASYPGASAQTLQDSVTQVLEQQLTGLDGLLYFQSSSSRGGVTINVTFDKSLDADIAQVQVQNAVQPALSRLPQQVQQQGVRVTKSATDFLLIIAISDQSGTYSDLDIADYLSTNIQDPVARIPGVGDVNVFGAPYAMRIWLDPAKLRAFALMPSDVIAAISQQNVEVAAGEVGGQPAVPGQMLNATVTAQSRLQTPEEFRRIIVKADGSGARVRLADLGRVELGGENYNTDRRLNGHPGAGMAVFLAPGADALETADLVKAEVARLAERFPPGFHYDFAYDTTDFIKLSIKEVVKTLVEAMILVIIVMFVFLQSWRATLVPAIAIPVVLLGTFGVLYALGFSINTMTLFGLVLAVGLLVDDAIVVVENVERILEENPELTPREATILSMGQIQMALVAIALVLSAVFLPMVFFGGSTGVIYRQFSATIVSAMVLSVFVATTLSPAIAALVLRPRRADAEADARLANRYGRVGRAWATFRDRFNHGFRRLSQWYVGTIQYVVDRKWLFLGGYAGVCALLAILFFRLPTGFLPTEDQGAMQIQFRLPAGATLDRTREVQRAVEDYLMRGPDKDNFKAFFIVAGGGQGATGQNAGQSFVNLADFDDRKGKDNSADALVERTRAAFSGYRDAQVFALIPPAIRGLGQSGGFNMQLQNSGGLSQAEFEAARERLLQMTQKDPLLQQVRLGELPDVATLKVDIEQERVSALGLSTADVNSTLSAAWGGRYVNDFIDRGRVKRVYVQGDAPFRMEPADIGQWSVRNAQGQMVPFSSFARSSWSTAPTSLSRFLGVQSYEFQGQPAEGRSTGEAMARMQELADQIPGVSVAWSGQSYEERRSGGQAPLLYAVSLLVVFLCLAALYESWSIPLAVLLVIPLGLVGAVFAVTLRGLQNDVYLQIGLLTTMGLTAKNAILMVEFAERAEKQGMRVIEAAIEAARIRLRPILMTSFAFIFGVLPLAISTGPGANSRIAIGTSVIGGMLTATILAVFYIPLFFVVVRRGAREGLAIIRERIRNRRREARA